jgi:hypothetical protein
MKKFVIASLLTLMLLIQSTNMTVQAQSGFIEYSNRPPGFTMVYPSGWTVNDTGFSTTIIPEIRPDVIIFTSPGHDATISLQVCGPVQ